MCPVHAERQRLSRREYLDCRDKDFDGTRSQLGIDTFGRPGDDSTVHRNHQLVPQALRRSEGGTGRLEHTLRDAAVVSKINEEQTSVITPAMRPAKSRRFLPNVSGRQRPTGVLFKSTR